MEGKGVMRYADGDVYEVFIFILWCNLCDTICIQSVWCDMQMVIYTRLSIIIFILRYNLFDAIWRRWRLRGWPSTFSLFCVMLYIHIQTAKYRRWQFFSWVKYLRSFLKIVYFRAGGREAFERVWARLFSRTVTTIVDTGPTTTWRMDLESLHVR